MGTEVTLPARLLVLAGWCLLAPVLVLAAVVVLGQWVWGTGE